MRIKVKLYKYKTKGWVEKNIVSHTFYPGQLLLLFNSRFDVVPKKTVV